MIRLPLASTCAVPLGPTDAGRLALLDDRRTLDGLVHRQAIVIVDRRFQQHQLMVIDPDAVP